MHCDYLILLTNSDQYIERKKGVVPISLLNRKKLLKSIYLVDEVHSFVEETEDNWVKWFHDQVMPLKFPKCKLVVCHSWETKKKKHIPGKDHADEIVYIPHAIRTSTTDIFERIRETK
jgi:bifunctional ADP-heptose synthase (sugar kinase/adenylyltransferase)